MACLQRLEDKLECLKDRLSAAKTPSLSGMPRGGTPLTTADLVADKIELERRIAKLKSKTAKIRSEILDEIDMLDDSRYVDVLEAYFIDGMTIEEVAARYCYTVRHAYRLYSDAILILALE